MKEKVSEKAFCELKEKKDSHSRMKNNEYVKSTKMKSESKVTNAENIYSSNLELER